jgi:hypothetical protein
MDVLQWAYGVTLWEVMSHGYQPYMDVDPTEMISYLQQGYRAAKPPRCPDDVYVNIIIINSLIHLTAIIIIVVIFVCFSFIWQQFFTDGLLLGCLSRGETAHRPLTQLYAQRLQQC